MGLRCNGFRRFFDDESGGSSYQPKRRRTYGSGSSRVYSPNGNSRIESTVSNEIESFMSKKKDKVGGGKPTPARPRSSSSKKNFYSRIADELHGGGKPKKRGGSCSWHKGISQNVSDNKRKSIERLLTRMEQSYSKKSCVKPPSQKRCGSQHTLLKDVLGRVDQLLVMDLPNEVRCELTLISKQLNQINASL
ncbi:MAG: hypothetical protein GF334_01780 [Candidatus Altiarchaeales archaeon]|nr:hypothetical protein [Candidatus Altiarchaeales archaeon]